MISKLRSIEALFAGATTDGERNAADKARERILQRLALLEREEPAVEHRFSMPDLWSRTLFLALLRRYGIRPYRRKGQRHTTVTAKVSRKFVDETLWPQYLESSTVLEAYLAEVTDRVVQQLLGEEGTNAQTTAGN
ncbi:MAG: hypothetical protein KDA27_28005 [Candidatus Eisenbacteria bacterium]|uniref:Uncharacterized protein n=1 Tax=Eiseniibacteriota bacterium TaxID=2212470 RepID=A0A956NI00_UNCEI|nr:hypothetical protein [Candidatus Eisenbacteria bacterium]